MRAAPPTLLLALALALLGACCSPVAAQYNCGESCAGDADCQQPGKECRHCHRTLGVCIYDPPGCGDPCDPTTTCRDASCSKCHPEKEICVWEGPKECGSFCTNSNQCIDNDECPYCNATSQRCEPSTGSCAGSCTQTSDCGGGGCQCTNGWCHAPAYWCGIVVPNCQDRHASCQQYGHCDRCTNERCYPQCGMPCNDWECLGAECSRCDAFSRTCAAGLPCGSPCSIDNDCDQTAPSNCRWCVAGLCQARCGQNCTASAQCGETDCGVCSGGLCRPDGSMCGRCQSDGDCGPTCPRCTDRQCRPYMYCGGQCKSDGDCGNQACPRCVQGTCAAPQCGLPCDDAWDCAPPCGDCHSGTCKPASCGSVCKADADCAGAGHCHLCRGGVCGEPVCGSVCDTSVDCRQTGNCTTCRYHHCEPAEPPQCGRECPPGNNNACPYPCGYCNPATATCTAGKDCFAPCKVNSDCNQFGSCRKCLGAGGPTRLGMCA